MYCTKNGILTFCINFILKKFSQVNYWYPTPLLSQDIIVTQEERQIPSTSKQQPDERGMVSVFVHVQICVHFGVYGIM